MVEFSLTSNVLQSLRFNVLVGNAAFWPNYENALVHSQSQAAPKVLSVQVAGQAAWQGIQWMGV
jgi:hypothetical protein